MTYEESFVAYLDFLGFSEASMQLDDSTRQKVLELLRSLVALRGEFSAVPDQSGHSIRPAVSTFSDHIVISYGLDTLRDTAKLTTEVIPFIIFAQLHGLISAIAAAALRLGFLIRGGATIGKLYHANGVVFGEALVEATQLETRTAVYPRVILSSTVSRLGQDWLKTLVTRDDDGIYCLDYITNLFMRAAPPGDEWSASVKQWFGEIVIVVKSNLDDLEGKGRLNELAKWTWFAKRFRAALANAPPGLMKTLGITLEAVPWGR